MVITWFFPRKQAVCVRKPVDARYSSRKDGLSKVVSRVYAFWHLLYISYVSLFLSAAGIVYALVWQLINSVILKNESWSRGFQYGGNF